MTKLIRRVLTWSCPGRKKIRAYNIHKFIYYNMQEGVTVIRSQKIFENLNAKDITASCLKKIVCSSFSLISMILKTIK